jgi:hypothetical protein
MLAGICALAVLAAWQLHDRPSAHKASETA